MLAFVRSYLCAPPPAAEKLRLDLTSRYPGWLVQTLSAGSASNGALIEMIAAQTVYSMAAGALIAKRPEVDMLMRFAGTDQIAEALAKVGATGGDPYVLVVAHAGLEGPAWVPPDCARELPKRRLNSREISRIEVAALLGASRAR